MTSNEELTDTVEELKSRLYRYRLVTTGFALFAIIQTVQLIMLWSGSLMNDKGVYCLNANKYGEAVPEILVMITMLIALSVMWWRGVK